MSFRKLCHMPFRKLIPPFTLTVKFPIFEFIALRVKARGDGPFVL